MNLKDESHSLSKVVQNTFTGIPGAPEFKEISSEGKKSVVLLFKDYDRCFYSKTDENKDKLLESTIEKAVESEINKDDEYCGKINIKVRDLGNLYFEVLLTKNQQSRKAA